MKKKTRSLRRNFPSALHLLASNDDYRPALSYISFTDGQAVVTNANCLIRQSFSFLSNWLDNIELLEGKLIHRNVFSRLYRECEIEIQSEGIMANDQQGNKFFYPYSYDIHKGNNYLGIELKLPNFIQVINSAIQNTSIESISDYAQIAINANNIHLLNNAMYHENVNGYMKYFLPERNSNAILVETMGTDSNDQMGLLMPTIF